MKTQPTPRRPDANPFRSEIIDRIPFRPQSCSWDELLARLESLGWRAAIIGPEGSGKTALLDELARNCNGRMVRLHGAERQPYLSASHQLTATTAPDDKIPRHVVAGGFIPPGDQVSAGINPAPTFGKGIPVVRRVAARVPREAPQDDIVFVDGAEQLGPVDWWRFVRQVRSVGGLVITSHRSGRLPTLIECRTSPTLLRELVTALAPEEVENLAPIIPTIFDRHQGNMRLCFGELYDRCAGRS